MIPALLAALMFLPAPKEWAAVAPRCDSTAVCLKSRGVGYPALYYGSGEQVHTKAKAGSGLLWQSCQLTQYARHFEGRRTASGTRFSHRGFTVASRHLPLGTRLVLRYRGRTHWHAVNVTVTDRGGLPLDRPRCYQFDVTRATARHLGLYAKRPDYRRAEWRIEQ